MAAGKGGRGGTGHVAGPSSETRVWGCGSSRWWSFLLHGPCLLTPHLGSSGIPAPIGELGLGQRYPHESSFATNSLMANMDCIVDMETGLKSRSLRHKRVLIAVPYRTAPGKRGLDLRPGGSGGVFCAQH